MLGNTWSCQNRFCLQLHRVCVSSDMPMQEDVPYAPESRATREAKSRMASYSKFFYVNRKPPESIHCLHRNGSFQFSGVFDLRKENFPVYRVLCCTQLSLVMYDVDRGNNQAIKISYRGGPAFWGAYGIAEAWLLFVVSSADTCTRMMRPS